MATDAKTKDPILEYTENISGTLWRCKEEGKVQTSRDRSDWAFMEYMIARIDFEYSILMGYKPNTAKVASSRAKFLSLKERENEDYE